MCPEQENKAQLAANNVSKIRESFITIGALRIPLREIGPADGVVILMLHGFPDCHHSFDFQLPVLAASGYRVIAPGLRGYSSGTISSNGDYFTTTIAQDIIGLMDVLNIDQCHLVGHDWGGIIGWITIAMYPDRFLTYTSLAIPPLYGMSKTAWRYPSQLCKSWYIFFFQLRGIAERKLAQNDFAFIERLWRIWSPNWIWPSDTMAHVKETFRQPGVPRAALGFYRHLFYLFSRQNRQAQSLIGKQIYTPCLVLHGKSDGALDSRIAACSIIESQFTQGVTFHVLDGAGHFLHLEQPEQVNRLLLDFLVAQSKSSDILNN